MENEEEEKYAFLSHHIRTFSLQKHMIYQFIIHEFFITDVPMKRKYFQFDLEHPLVLVTTLAHFQTD